MTACVVDASVAAKWFVEEAHSAEALTLLAPARDLLVPDLFYPELGNVLWKKVRRGEMEAEDAREAIASLVALEALEARRSPPLMPYALELALRHDCTVYDALYLALAVHADCPLITADQKFRNRVAEWFPAERIVWLGELA